MKKKCYLKEDIEEAFEIAMWEIEKKIKKYVSEEKYDVVVSLIDNKNGVKVFRNFIERLRTFDVECEEQEK